MNKVLLSFIPLLFYFFAHSQTDTTRIIPPKPDSLNNVEKQPEVKPEPAATKTVTPKPEEPKRKRPKGYDDYVNKGKRPADVTPFTDNLYYGCNLQLGYYAASYGNVLYYDLSPHVGYKFNEFFSAGIQVIYSNQTFSIGASRYNYNIFGAGVFGRALILDRFFFQAEIDVLSIPANYRGNTIVSRVTSDEKMFGLGYKSPLGDKLSYFFVLLYDFQPGPNSPYPPLVYRAGLSWNF